MTQQIPRGVGRPRRASVDAAVLEATADLVAERAYGRITIDAIAERAGVAKTTLYRRWASKPELAVDALAGVLGEPPAPTGADADTVRAAVTWLADRVRIPAVRHLLVGLVDEAGRDAELRQRLRERIRQPFTRRLATLWDADDDDVDLAFDVVVGTLLHRFSMQGDVTGRDVETVVELATLTIRGRQGGSPGH